MQTLKNLRVFFYRHAWTASRLQSHYGESKGPRDFLVLILPTSEGWKTDLNLELPGGFEPGTPGLVRSRGWHDTDNRNIFRYQTTNFQKFDSCFWFPRKGRKRIKTSLLLNLWELHLKLFSNRNISQIASKISATQCFFTYHLKHKTVNNTTFWTPSANSCQVCAH